MPNPLKLVNNDYIEMTDDEVAQMEAWREEADLNLGPIRAERDTFLKLTDCTQVTDFPLGSDSSDDWQTYRQELRDLLATSGLRRSNVVWPKSPVVERVGQAAYDSESDAALKDNARTVAETAAGYPAPGI